MATGTSTTLERDQRKEVTKTRIDMKSEKEVTESRTGIRSYQILTVIGSLLIIWDLIGYGDKISIEVLAVSIFAIISVFLFRNHTRAIGFGLIALVATYFFVPTGFDSLNFRPYEMIIFGAGAVTALRYKTENMKTTEV